LDPLFRTGVVIDTLGALQTTSRLNGLGAPITTPNINTDIFGDARNATRPDIGADEFLAPNCTGTSGATAAASVANLCVSGSGQLSSTGYQVGEGISYLWQR
jgi:hypothetical protein